MSIVTTIRPSMRAILICIKGNNREGHASNKNTEFANNGFQRKKIISSIDRSDDGIKLGVKTMKKTIDEIIIIDGHPKARELETWLCECGPPSRKTLWFCKYLLGEFDGLSVWSECLPEFIHAYVQNDATFVKPGLLIKMIEYLFSKKRKTPWLKIGA